MQLIVDVTVTDPDHPHGSPAYDGPANRAHERLVPGVYAAASSDDVPGKLVVGDGVSAFEVTR